LVSSFGRGEHTQNKSNRKEKKEITCNITLTKAISIKYFRKRSTDGYTVMNGGTVL